MSEEGEPPDLEEELTWGAAQGDARPAAGAAGGRRRSSGPDIFSIVLFWTSGQRQDSRGRLSPSPSSGKFDDCSEGSDT